MILITGGIASGRHTYAARLCAERGVALQDCAEIRRETLLLYRENAALCVEHLCRSAVVIAQETGCAPVPADSEERALRGLNGSLTQELAMRAQSVFRMVCGIALQVK